MLLLALLVGMFFSLVFTRLMGWDKGSNTEGEGEGMELLRSLLRGLTRLVPIEEHLKEYIVGKAVARYRWGIETLQAIREDLHAIRVQGEDK